jgi:glutamyl-tRNA synthetase
VIQTLQPRSKTLKEMAQGARFYYLDPVEFEEKAVKKFLTPTTLPVLTACSLGIQALATYTQESLEALFKQVMDNTGLKFGKIAQPLRVALTGTTVSPGIFEMLLALGQEKAVQRIDQAVQMVQNRADQGTA